MAAAATGGRPRSTRGGSSKRSLAYDLGHRGEDAPAWLGDHPDYADAYEEGVSDRDATGGADTGRREDTPPRAHRRDTSRSSASNVVPISTARSAPPASSTRRASTSSAPAPAKGSSAIVTAGGSVASAVLGAFAFALLRNVIEGTGTKWLSAKWTNGDGKLP
jgi:hypothetical protein